MKGIKDLFQREERIRTLNGYIRITREGFGVSVQEMHAEPGPRGTTDFWPGALEHYLTARLARRAADQRRQEIQKEFYKGLRKESKV